MPKICIFKIMILNIKEEIMATLLKLGIVIFVWLCLDFLIVLVIRK